MAKAENKDLQMENEVGSSAKEKLVSSVYKEEYFRSLKEWINEARAMQSISNCFPYFLMVNYPQMFTSTAAEPLNVNVTPPVETRFLNNNYRPANFWVSFQRLLRARNANRVAENAGDAEIISLHGGIEYVIPPLWKRFVAEFIDFLILFFLKLAVTFVAVDFFNFVDLDKFDVEAIKKNIQEDYKVALEMTSEILILELIHRIIVCFFEAAWLQGGIAGHIGGATPGKAIMKLRVVYVSAIIPVPGRLKETVLIYTGDNLGLALAFGRSLVKNLLLALLFPMCFALFFFQYNRTCYDMLCHSIVVEHNPNIQRRRQP